MRSYPDNIDNKAIVTHTMEGMQVATFSTGLVCPDFYQPQPPVQLVGSLDLRQNNAENIVTSGNTRKNVRNFLACNFRHGALAK